MTTLQFNVPIFLKSGSLKLLQSSGPVKACNGIDLPLRVFISWEKILTIGA
jgi:uncharacterized protein with PQ loop repeat